MSDESAPARATVVSASNRSSPQPAAMHDCDIWNKILDLKLEGAEVHSKLAHLCKSHGMWGFAKMHKYHAICEFISYQRLAFEFIDMFGKCPQSMADMGKSVSISGSTICDKMKSSLAVYDDWETDVLEHIREYRSKLKDVGYSIPHEIHSVIEEIAFIDKIYECIEKHGSTEEGCKKIDEWLCSMFKEKLKKYYN